jgi:hypothetical protein
VRKPSIRDATTGVPADSFQQHNAEALVTCRRHDYEVGALEVAGQLGAGHVTFEKDVINLQPAGQLLAVIHQATIADDDQAGPGHLG